MQQTDVLSLRLAAIAVVGVFVGLTARFAWSADGLMPGETTDPYVNDKLKIKLIAPKELPLLFRTEEFARDYGSMPLVEFRVAPGNMRVSVTGAILMHNADKDFKAWASKRTPPKQVGAEVKGTEVLKDEAVNRSPGEWRVIDLKVKTDFATMLERHVCVSTGNGLYVELVMIGNIREEKFLADGMDAIAAGFSVNTSELTKKPKEVQGGWGLRLLLRAGWARCGFGNADPR